MKTKYNICFIFFLWSIVLLSCSKEETTFTPTVKVSSEEILFGKLESEKNIYIQSNVQYQINCDATEWCIVTKQESTSTVTDKYLVTVKENSDINERSATISVIADGIDTKNIKVIQYAQEYLSPDENDITISGEEGTPIEIKMTNNGDYQINIDCDWITKDDNNQTRAVKENIETFKATRNILGTERVGTITFTLENVIKTVTIRQSPAAIPEADDTGMENDAETLLKKINIGWNLGNTLEVPGSETAWGNPYTTEEMIVKVKELGFNAIRIPCAWNSYLNSQETYEIKQSWLKRVKEVVDYCVNNDVYAILNIHWDDGWLENSIPNGYSDEVNNKQRILWTQIANYFRDYDEHLLFAGCNEPNVNKEEEMETLLKYEQTFIDAVRATGGKNKYRNLIIQGPGTDIDKTNNWMNTLPTDNTVTNRLIMEIHYYSPSTFCILEYDADWGKAQFFWGENNSGYATGIYEGRWNDDCNEDYLEAQFEKMKTRFINNGIPVIIGEFAPCVKQKLSDPTAQAGHDKSRADYNECVVREAKERGLVPFYWDAGSGVFNRQTLEILDQGEYDALMKGAQQTYPN